MNGIDSSSVRLEGNLPVDYQDMEQHKAFLGIDERDIALIKELQPLLAGDAASLADEFYSHLLAFDETRRLLQDEALLSRLKGTQAAYFKRLVSGVYNQSYIQDRIRVGVAHQRVGLPPKWYIGAYSRYVSSLLPRITQLMEGNERKATDAMLALLKIIFFDMGIAIDTYIRADEQAIQDKAALLAALNQVAISISSTLSLPEIPEKIMHSGISLTGAKGASLAFYNAESGCLDEWHTMGVSDGFAKTIAARGGCLAQDCVTRGSYLIASDSPDTAYRLDDLTRREGILSFICVPLPGRAHPMGALYFFRDDRDTFYPEEIELLSTFAYLAAGSIENARLHARTLSLATTDTLTSLLNRRAFDERLTNEVQRSRRYNKAFTLMILDIDHFKRINDDYGHPSGDSVLRTLATILLNQTRDTDFVARYGGEEFAIILPETATDGAKNVANRIRQKIASMRFLLSHDVEINITASLGLAVFPACADTAESLLECADQALYHAKNHGRDQICIYHEVAGIEDEARAARMQRLLGQNAATLAGTAGPQALALEDHAGAAETLAVRLGERLQLDKGQLRALRLAAILQDIGYTSVPDSLLPDRESVAAQDWETAWQDPANAAEVLARIPAFQEVAPIIRHQHEWVDGSGYPAGLTGATIPYLARVLAVVGMYCAAVTDRPHHPALAAQAARQLIQARAGRQFDVEIAAEFTKMLGEGN